MKLEILYGIVIVFVISLFVLFGLRHRVTVVYPNVVFWNSLIDKETVEKQYSDGQERIAKTGDPNMDYEWHWIWEKDYRR